MNMLSACARIGMSHAQALMLLVLAHGLAGQAVAPLLPSYRHDVVSAELSRRETAVLRVKEHVESTLLYTNATNAILDECTSTALLSQPACSATLRDGSCMRLFGDTDGCECDGRMLSTDSPVVMTAAPGRMGLIASSPGSLLNFNENRENFATACLAHAMRSTFQSEYVDFIEQGDVKWLYVGLENGNLINYPGFLWPRDSAGCGASEAYDPRIRPWHLSGATGPKNVVFILDVSGSMSLNNRIGFLKKSVEKIIESLTHDDYVSIIAFNDAAETYKQHVTMAQAMPKFRIELAKWVRELEAGGGTNFEAAFDLAFHVVNHSEENNYSSGCETVYVFLTDGQASVPATLEARLQLKQVRELASVARGLSVNRDRNEYYFFIGLGDDVDTQVMNTMACMTKGSYHHVADNDENDLEAALFAFRKLFVYKRARRQDEHVSWSEMYVSIPNVFGFVTTASVPIYDKRDPSNWQMVGVAAADVAVCGLQDTISATFVRDPVQKTKRGCECEPFWRYNDLAFGGAKTCTSIDWPTPWCAVSRLSCPSAICDSPSISTHCWDDCMPDSAMGVLDGILDERSHDTCSARIGTVGDLNSRNAEDACLMDQLSDAGSSDRCVDVGGGGDQCQPAGAVVKAQISARLQVPTIGTTPSIGNGAYAGGGFLEPTLADAFVEVVGPSNERLRGMNSDKLIDCNCTAAREKPACTCESRAEADDYLQWVETGLERERGDRKADEEDDVVGKAIGIAIAGISVLFVVIGVAIWMKKRKHQKRSIEQQHRAESEMQRNGTIAQSAPAHAARFDHDAPPPVPMAYSQYPPPPSGMVGGYLSAPHPGMPPLDVHSAMQAGPPPRAPYPGADQVMGIPIPGPAFPVVQPQPGGGNPGAPSASYPTSSAPTAPSGDRGGGGSKAAPSTSIV